VYDYTIVGAGSAGCVPRCRVVGGSSSSNVMMPTVPRGNTNAPLIAVAERAAYMVSGRAPLAALEPVDLALAAAP
jgi:choline dehydrogenase